jgi:YegS/Rv2252/BmrU family lipid kinase
MEKKKIRFIINPVSGVGKKKNIIQLIEQYIDKSKFQYEIVYTQKEGHAISLSKQAADNNYYAVIAVGGDGSINEVGSSLIETNTALAIIPVGSGNGFANHFHIPHNISEAINLINTGKVISVDTIAANDRKVIGICGIGFDAQVAHVFANYGKRGISSYIKIILKEYFKYKPNVYKILVDDKVIEKKAWLITFANASQFGNNANINPWADIQDGILEICILKKMSLLKIPKIIYFMYVNKMDQLSFFEIIRTKSATLFNSENHILHIDGEPVTLGTTIVFNINSLSLKVIVPNNFQENIS